MRYSLFIILALFYLNIDAQSAATSAKFAGHYSAMVNGEKITLTIQHKDGPSYTGTLHDGYTTMDLVLTLSGNMFEGIATVPSQSVNIGVDGEIDGDQLIFYFIVDPYGEEADDEIIFSRDATSSTTPTTNSAPVNVAVVFPSGATHPKEMFGTWTKEELYQSGYGDAYMGAGTTQSMTFLAEGRMADAGSSSYISGSDYSGQSSGQGGGVIPGVSWYTIGNQLYLQASENGQTQNIHLGKYYIENNNMLITGTNGEKVLLTRN